MFSIDCCRLSTIRCLLSRVSSVFMFVDSVGRDWPKY
jgi:hypothetical protein